MNRLVFACLSLLLTVLTHAAHADDAIPADESFCRGIGLMTSSLSQHLQHGMAQEQAIDAVLDETGAPKDDSGPHRFLGTVAELVNSWHLDADTSGQLLYLSCWRGGLFGDAAAQKDYRKHLPGYLAATRQCVAKSAKTDRDAKLRCMSIIFN